MVNDGSREATFQKLIDEGSLEIGDGYRAKNNELGGTGPIFLRAGHVSNTHIDFSGVERFYENLRDRLRQKFAMPGDTIVTTKGNSTGRTSFVTDQMPEFVYSPHLSYWRSRNPKVICGGFLRYWSRGAEFITQLRGMSASTDMAPYLSLTDQRRLRITLPPITQQEHIADILGTLDDKIDLNRRMNETLEAMARRLFKSWFIDFDPVHIKAALRREHPKLSNPDLSRRALPNMAPEIAGIFPDSFEESTLGPVPKGWNARTVPDAIEVNPSRSITKGTVVPWLEMANMPTRSVRVLAWERREFKSGTKFINGDTLVARITPCLENGKTAFVDFLEDDEVGAGSTEYIVLRPPPPLPPVFAYLLARTDDFRQHLITNMTGTSGRQRVPADCLNTFPLVTPPKEIAECFARTTGDLFAQMKTIDEESFALTATRDKLLPRILAGDLQILGHQ